MTAINNTLNFTNSSRPPQKRSLFDAGSKYSIGGSYTGMAKPKTTTPAVPVKSTVMSPVQDLSQYNGSKNPLVFPGLAQNRPGGTVTGTAPTGLVDTTKKTTDNAVQTPPPPGAVDTKRTAAGTGGGNEQDNTGFGGLIKRVTKASDTNKTQADLLKKMQEAAEGNKAIGQSAADLSKKYGEQIAEVGRLGAGAVAGNMSTGSNIVGSGNAAIASQSASSRMSALSQAQTAALQGTGQQLTAQSQVAGAYGTALGGANTQQAQQVQGLGTAASLAQPVQVPYGNQFLNPMTGESSGGAGLGGYAGYNAAQQAIALGSQYPDAGYQYNPAMTPEQNLQAAQQAIQGSPTYQRTTYGVPGQTSIQGATTVQTAQAGYNEASQSYNQLYSAFTNADKLADNALNILAESGVNPTDVKFANRKIADVKRQLSSVQQQKFDTAMQEARNAFAGVVASYGGQTPTDIGAAYSTLLDPNAEMGAVSAAIGQLKLAGQTRLQAEQARVQQYYSQLGGGGATGGGGGGGTITWDSL